MRGSVTIEPLGFRVADEARELVRISPEGKVTLGEGISVDEAAQAFWNCVEVCAQRNMDFVLRAGVPIVLDENE